MVFEDKGKSRCWSHWPYPKVWRLTAYSRNPRMTNRFTPVQIMVKIRDAEVIPNASTRIAAKEPPSGGIGA